MAHFKPTNRRRSSSSFCHRHPSLKPTTGFCPSCLHERLSTLQTLSSPPDLPRLRSYSVRNTSTTTSDQQQPRRRSCDDARSNTNSLHDLFLDDDVTSIQENDNGEEHKTMKEFIDLDYGNQIKKKNNNGFTKKLKNVIGRRSCDVDPFDRSSFEKPRASLDGCLIEKTYTKLTPLCTVIEDGKDLQEKQPEEEKSPGGGVQTRDYYSDSRRRSFDRSISVKGQGLLEVDELKAVGLFHGAKLLVTETELRDSNWYSMKCRKAESVEVGNICVGASDGKVDGVEVKKAKKKWPKGWNLWGLIQRKNEVKTEKSLTLEGNAVEGSLAESLLKLRKVAKGETNGGVSEKLLKSYNVSARKSCDGVFSGANVVGGFEGGRSSCDGLFHGSINGVDVGRSSCDGLVNGIEGKQNHQRSSNGGTCARASVDNSLFRFYLTPVRSQKSSKSLKTRLMN